MSWSYCEKNHRCYETDPTETQTKPFIKSDQTEYNRLIYQTHVQLWSSSGSKTR